MIFLDTHVLLWLYEGLLRKIPMAIQQKINTMDLFISPMVELELNFLCEIGRTSVSGVEVVRYLDAHLGLTVSRVDFYRIIEEAQQHSWTRDPFDRLIVSNAAIFQAPLLTKDHCIQQHYAHAIWE